ncbi:MarR family transcriptional regulator [Clostridium sediminicola]|uniref:MarR family winged helix-turn-helix transcriptional regulator n=1 Tax=Clostridium sediminicola TaxID=3114879 RepID=UPI0031F27915
MYNYEDDSIYNLFSEVVKLRFSRMRTLFDEVGIYPGQHAMLFALNNNDGQSQKELSKKLNIKPATITVMINRMERTKLVERRQDSNDQRISRVYLTDAGKDTWRKVDKILKSIDEVSFSNFTEEQQKLLSQLLLQIKENLLSMCTEYSLKD